jgi:hypothetical protein
LYGILVVTTAPAGATGTAYPGVGATAAVTYNAEVPLLLSEIDPIQNLAVNAAVTTVGFSESATRGGYPPEPVASVSVDDGVQATQALPRLRLWRWYWRYGDRSH